MSWFGGVMNGNNTAYEIEVTYTAGALQGYYNVTAGGSDMTNVWVDWGDGSAFEQVSAILSQPVYGKISHTYAAGTYRFRVFQQDFELTTGNDIAWQGYDYANSFPNVTNPKFISFGLVTTARLIFGHNSNSGNTQWNFAHLQNYPISLDSRDFTWMFSFIPSQATLNDNFLVDWFNTPALSPTTIVNFFYGTNITQVQNIGNWDMSACTNMQGALYWSNSASLNPNLSGWNLSACTSLQRTFWSQSSFNNGGDAGIGDWDTSNVTTFDGTFRNCSAFNQDIGGWSMASVVTFGSDKGILEGCSAFDQDISAWGTNDGGMNTTAATFTKMLTNCGMSTTNYSRWLICLANWAYDNSYTTAETLGATSLTYNNTTHSGIGSGQYTDAVSARAYLVTTLGWTVQDSGVV